MEEDGILTRTVYPEVPPRVEYVLSDLGQPCARSLKQWPSGAKTIKTGFKKKDGQKRFAEGL